MELRECLFLALGHPIIIKNIVSSHLPTLCRDPFRLEELQQSAFCGMLEAKSPLLELSSLLFFLLPFLVMVHLYVCMSVKVRHSTKIMLGYGSNETDKRLKNRKAILKMLGMKCYKNMSHTPLLLMFSFQSSSWIM